MKKIASFTMDHMNLEPGIYVSRKDKFNDAVITTFDIRVTRPNREPAMNNAPIHTFEHLGATYLRNNPEYMDKIAYFGPMGCRTGFYLLMAGDLDSKDIVPLVRGMFEFVVDFEGDIPGAEAEECGNYLEHNLDMAKYVSKKFIEEILDNITERNLVY